MGIIGSYSQGGAGEIVPAVKYNAIKGKFYKVEREQVGDGWESTDVEVPLPLSFVADFENIEVGQMAFIANRPDFHMVRLADVEAGEADVPDRPTPEHRFGFRVRLYSQKAFDGLREWRGQAKVLTSAMDALYEEWKADPKGQKAGALPVIKITGTQSIKRGGQYPGTDEAPIMEISKYVERPEGLTVPTVETPASQPADDTPANLAGKSKHAPPPSKAAAEDDDGDEF